MGKTGKRLIVTGWGWLDYAGAAALALRHMPDADVVGMSVRRLPEFLETVSGYREILILGVGLVGDPLRLAKAVDDLSCKDVALRWLSVMPLPDLPEKTCRSLNPCVDATQSDLLGVVSNCLKMPADDVRVALVEPKTRSKDKALSYPLLFKAAMFAHRNYQDEKAYENAVRHLALGDAPSRWSTTELELIKNFIRFGDRELVGKSATMEALRARMKTVAKHDHARVLIFGESGTGKEMVAFQIHDWSPRRKEPYIAFNCASVNPSLLESRFFGYEKGAFTGAAERKSGLFEQANGGTLFLDEIGELPLEAQGILLRILEVGRFTRMGGEQEVEIDVRLIAATHRDLAGMVRDGKFRADLFYRLNVVQINVAPLRAHKEDIEKIANRYWLKHNGRRLAAEQIAALQNYDYPGNVRELVNLLERASVLNETDFVQLIAEQRQSMASLLPSANPAAGPGSAEWPERLDDLTRLHVRRVYEKHNKNIAQTVTALGIARNTVKKWLHG